MNLVEIKNRIYNDIVASFDNAITPLRKSVFDVIATTYASAIKLLYIYLNNVQKDSFVTTCTQDRLLSYYAPLKNIIQKPATKATGIVTFMGEAGAVIKAGTVITYNNLEYVTTSKAIISNNLTANANAESVGTGTKYNTLSNIQLEIITPIDGVNNTLSSSAGFGGALDEESIEAVRTRTILKNSTPSHIDSVSHYKTEVLKLNNIKAAFVSKLKNGNGTFGLTCLTYSNGGVPTQSDLNKLKNSISIPAYVDCEFFIPQVITVDFSLSLVDNNDEKAKKEAIELLTNYLYTYQEPSSTFYYFNLHNYLLSKKIKLLSPLKTDIQKINSNNVLDVGVVSWV